MLLFSIPSFATDTAAPAIEWVRTYNYPILDVCETADQNFFIGSLSVAYFINSNGSRLLTITANSIGWYNFKFENLLPLSDGGFLVTGTGKITEESSYSLPILRLNSEGDVLWCKSYGTEEFTEYAFDAIELPDNGFAIAGEINPTEGMNQAWILRTDSQGDTLWTREWGWEAWDRARGILYCDNAITVLCSGRLEGDPGGTYIVRYNLNGDLLSEYRIPEMQGQYGWDFCNTFDAGLFIVDNYHPEIFHTDIYGNYLWHINPPGWGDDWGWTINSTMDGGIIFGGENAEAYPDGSKTDLSGMISRHDSEGNELWRDYVYNSGCVAIYSVRQLSQGGYIAAGEAFSVENGVQGVLIKYAPEVGIESQEGSSSVVAINSISPNPISLTASIEFSLAEAGSASLTLYDLNGRVVDTISEGVFTEGSNIVQWSVSEELSNGCYLICLESISGNDASHFIVLK